MNGKASDRVCCWGRLPKEKFFQFAWRPRPPTCLSKEQEDDILKNLKKYSRKFDEEDAAILNMVCIPRDIIVIALWQHGVLD